MSMNGFQGWEKVQADFPVNGSLIWLNNCGTTPLANPVRKVVQGWLEEYSLRGVLAQGFSYAGVKASIYRRLESLLNARPGELALVHNTSEGMNLISHGLSLQAGEGILLLENEYPSNVYPWEHWKEKGVTLGTVPLPSRPEDFPSLFDAAAVPGTRVASISAVHWCTGMPFPLSEIGSICAGKGISLVVDGSQGVGLIDIDVQSAGIAYMAFSAWKWLLGPTGLGILYISRDRLDGLKPIFKGTESVVRDQEYLPYKSDWKPSADRFSYSTGSMTDWVYFDASLAYLEAIGFSRARERIRELALHLSVGLRQAGFRLVSDAYPGGETGIVAAMRPGLDASAAVKTLRARGIVAADRLGCVRFSPHIYNSFAQLDQVIKEMSNL